MYTQRFSRTAAWIIALALLTFFPPGLGVQASPAADIEGNTYTSPQFGHKVTWDNTWFVIEETSEAEDSLTLTNGVTFAGFIGAKAYAGNAAIGVAAEVVSMTTSPDISNLEAIRDADGNAIRGGGETRSYAAFSFTQTYADGSTMDLESYLEIRTLVPGQAVLEFVAVMPAGNFESQMPAIQTLAAGIDIPGQEATTEGTEPELVRGEPAPVFATGRWRVAVVTAAQNDSLPGVGLAAKSGKEWIVVVADVTNWSEDDADFAAKEFTVRFADSERPGKLAAASTRAVAKALEIEPIASDLTIEIKAGETTRVALAFQVPAGGSEPVLVRDDAALPLDDALQFAIEPDELSPLAGPPKMRTAEVTGVVDGQTLKLQFEGKDKSQRIALLGVSAPAKDDCYGAEAIAALNDLKGATVYVESDEAVAGGSVPARYVWVEQDSGTRILLNQQLIAGGMAEPAELPSEARFGAWLAGSGRSAEADGVGLWAGCTAPVATPVASPAAVDG